MGSDIRCDLIMLSWNHLDYTQPAVESILKNTDVPCRLIIVDQNSDKQTQAYLRNLKSTPQVEVAVLYNTVNVGYSKGMNLGLKLARAPYVCFLNNDILVPPGWLKEMIKVAEADSSIGTVCPASNTFDIHPAQGSTWATLAQSRTAKTGRWIEIPYGEGFCLLAKRELMQRIGGFDDTTYEHMYFEDADLGRRIHAQGLRCVAAEGTYVWHHGGATTKDYPEREKLFQQNERRFIAKWGPLGKSAVYLLAKPTQEQVRKVYELARAEANRSGVVWLMLAHPPLIDHLPRHINIKADRFNKLCFPAAALLKLLVKKKKPQVIRCDLPWLRAILKPLQKQAVVEAL